MHSAFTVGPLPTVDDEAPIFACSFQSLDLTEPPQTTQPGAPGEHDETTPPAEPASSSSKHAGMSADEIARELSNPNSDLAQLKFKNIFTLYDGDLPNADDQWNYTLLFQPIFPFSLSETDGKKLTMFLRPAIPFIVEAPYFDADDADFSNVTALGDISFDWTFGLTDTNTGWLLAGGMIGTLPTATDSRLGSGKLSLGPEFLLGHQIKLGLFAHFPTHKWDVLGWGDQYVSTTTIEPVALFFLGDGWVAGTNGTMSYDWRTEQWTIPLNLTVSKTTHIGKLPLKVECQIEYYVEQDDAFGPEWAFYLNLTPVVPNFIEGLFKGG